MWYLKKIIAWLLVFAILTFSLCAPAFAATDPAPTDSRGTFYDWAMRPGGSFGGDDREHFGGGRPKYDEWVSTLPATGYTSDGFLLFPVEITRHEVSESYYTCDNHSTPLRSLGTYRVNFLCSQNTIKLSLNDGKSSFTFKYLGVKGTLTAPYDGYYQCICSPSFVARAVSSSGEVSDISDNYSESSRAYFSAGSTIFNTSGSNQYLELVYFSRFGFDDLFSAEVTFFPSYYRYTPAPSVDPTYQNQYNITTRPTTITGGNYGIIGDNGQITTVTNTTQIINEGDNLYYNPATGQTQTITDWTYNYDGRIYNITLDTGDKVSVEYGDENITITENTINEGDTIVNNYTIYYIIDGSGSGDNSDPTPGPTACPHDWQAGSSTAPTCTAPGKTAYTCSKCGETKTETVPALGHDWKVVRTVPTEYDENGTQTQAGYTLYECTRCGEQYKDTDSTGPPGDDVDDGGLLAWLNSLIQHLSDNLSGVVALIKRFFTEIPELFGGFTGFLAAVFPFLPEEITLLLTFGMAALVVVGVIKAIRR